MKPFDESNLPDLDVVVRAAPELFMRQGVPRLDLGRCQIPVVVDRSGKDRGRRMILKRTLEIRD